MVVNEGQSNPRLKALLDSDAFMHDARDVQHTLYGSWTIRGRGCAPFRAMGWRGCRCDASGGTTIAEFWRTTRDVCVP